MSYLGEYYIDELLTFPCNTHAAATGAATDADAVPPYRVYEDETGTAILTGNMAKLDDANTVGFYSEQLTLSAANGFELAKCYTIYIAATVSSVVGTMNHTFRIRAAPALASALADVQSDTNDIQSRIPTALTSGRINANVGAIEANAITEAAFANNAISDAKVASDVTIASVTGAVGSVAGAVGSVTAAVTVGTNNDKTGYALSAAGILAIWDTLTSALDAVGSIGELLVAMLDATIGSRATQTSVNTVDTVVDAILVDTGTDGVVVAAASKTGYALSATGLDTIPVTAPTGPASTFRQMVVQTWRRHFKRSVLNTDDGEIITYADDGTTPITTQVVSDDGTEQVVEAAT